ncbi:DUF2691 family protein [Bacillus pseudomycoides]|uniref:DUF2691 family protein n=1 Tax=Bacillus pseudomycoides TaxID=64104 RepID=UPI000BEFD0D2|nr:DUF2691 family protein [Bacillus pseudomycoides]PEJ26525.1 hypothetical protein CN677_28515 [Bacillus pseudomycoides]PGE94652.1 hypothetical protein COM62_23085 [Bacillus pseudomycoides]PHA76217.1 hypothetical protein COE78_29500 [Bacillus pseudomycoides]PHC74322.1 hypothetical protein COF38_17830 [Bacillus pseudomycoides]PHE32833.1 hypothetical protein COF51_25915 [Bacillus pseudomycoides]
MNIGIHFHAPEDENFNLSILSLLEPFNFQDYMWQIDDAEIHVKDECGNFTNEMLFDNKRFIAGHKLEETLQNKDYYLIFLTMAAFPDMKKSSPTWVTTATDFINSDCEFLLSIVDGFDISILCKNEDLLKTLYQHVQDLGYLDTKYLTENTSGTF